MAGGRGKLGRGGGVVDDVKSWSKMVFLSTFWKITTYWSPLDERVRSSFAEKRNVESGTSTREERSKTAQKPLKSCLKNRSKITARNERFFKQDLSGLSGFSNNTAQNAQTAQTAQILLENRTNRSNFERFLSVISTRGRKNDQKTKIVSYKN